MGGLVLLNDEIHAARDVTKTSTMRLQTFRSADFGALGHAGQEQRPPETRRRGGPRDEAPAEESPP